MTKPVLSDAMATSKLIIEAGDGGADAQTFVTELGAAFGKFFEATPSTTGTSVVVPVNAGRL